MRGVRAAGRKQPSSGAEHDRDCLPGFAIEHGKADLDVALRCFTDGYNRGLMATADQIIAPQQVHHDPAVPNLPVGPAGIKGLWTAVRTGFPDIHRTITRTMVDQADVLVQWKATGTHQGPLFGIPATGKAIAITGMHRFRMGRHQIQESWASWDALGLFQQIGMTLAPAK